MKKRNNNDQWPATTVQGRDSHHVCSYVSGPEGSFPNQLISIYTYSYKVCFSIYNRRINIKTQNNHEIQNLKKEIVFLVSLHWQKQTEDGQSAWSPAARTKPALNHWFSSSMTFQWNTVVSAVPLCPRTLNACATMAMFGQQVGVSTSMTISGNATLHGLTVWLCYFSHVAIVPATQSAWKPILPPHPPLYTFHNLPSHWKRYLVVTCNLSISPCFKIKTIIITEPSIWTCRQIPLTKQL